MLEKTLEGPLDSKEIQPVHPKGDQSRVFIRIDVEAIWCEELTHWKRPWYWKRLGAGGEGDDRGWDGWMASLTQWTRVWVDSGSWWWTGRAWHAAVHGVAKSRTRLSNWTELNFLNLPWSFSLHPKCSLVPTSLSSQHVHLSKSQLSPAPSLNYFTMKCVLNPLVKKCLICKSILHHPWGFYHGLQQWSAHFLSYFWSRVSQRETQHHGLLKRAWTLKLK